MLLLLLMFDLLSCSNADTFSLVVPDGAVSGQLGSSVVLPCAVSSSLDCTDYEIRWYGPNDNDNPILLYRDLKVQENAGDPQYRGRASLIGELQKGNVSLKLENLTVADRGEYVCFVSSYQWYEKESIFVAVPVVGSPPVLSCTEAGEQVNVTCTSGGWSPNITIIWRDTKGRELRKKVDHFTTDSEGLVSVSSWLLFSPSESEWISCSVGLSDQEMKEGRVLAIKPAYLAFTISLIISLLLLVAIATLILKIREIILPH
ncbi:butyrophilin subfamily 1 member A1-like, partial [Colossoma macropomum]|uniref:butyrophilin subfamily 1 member A1-like n=1 Tax=Colossoma macropomum TaxID=42526 RepID=UPI001864ACB7